MMILEIGSQVHRDSTGEVFTVAAIIGRTMVLKGADGKELVADALATSSWSVYSLKRAGEV